ncbi:MAG: Hemerythrin cation binding domain protein [Ramlibacter sp.]|nr:Hemerythrin cation binding domain protein [Ramlibacter sp.]
MKPRLDSLVSSPAAGFDQPFEMMTACHERMQRTLELLRRLRAHVASHGADEQARQAARDVMRYFDRAAPQHHQDEELHVFPPLVAKGDPAALALVQRLRQDHVRMEAGWSETRRLLDDIAEGRLATLSSADEAVLDAFSSLYAGHIDAEEEVAYPGAAALLDAAAVQAMGQEMSRRRGGPK